MIIEAKTDKFKTCVCGHKPDSYSIGYGRTPYNMSCNCGKQLVFSKYLVTGGEDNLVDYWNNHLAGMTSKEVEKEYKAFLKEKTRECGYFNEGYSTYEYYWYMSTGEFLHKK